MSKLSGFLRSPMPTAEPDTHSWLYKLMGVLDNNFINLQNAIGGIEQSFDTLTNEHKVFTANAAHAAGDICMLNSSGEMELADASAESTADSLIAMCMETVASGAEGKYLLRGTYTTSGLTTGSVQYLSTTAGDLTETAPSTSTEVVRILGYALSATEFFFDPSKEYTVVP